MKLQNKVVLVTGGANGIGKSCVKAFYNEGMKVIFIDMNIKNGKNYYYVLFLLHYFYQKIYNIDKKEIMY